MIDRMSQSWSALMPPVRWKARHKAWVLFLQGLTPKDISPRKVLFIKRRTLYRYYREFKTTQREFGKMTKVVAINVILSNVDSPGDDEGDGMEWLPPMDSVIPPEPDDNGD